MLLIPGSSVHEHAAYLCTLPAIRERCARVHDLAQQGKLEYLEYHPEKEKDVVDFCVGIIKRDFGEDYASIPPHGRWRHLDAGHPRIAPLLAQWTSQASTVATTTTAGTPGDPEPATREACKRLIDLFLVSVLLDAGAGATWTYSEPASGSRFARSEGLAVASVDMFKRGMFSGVAGMPHRVDAEGLGRITEAQIAAAMQVSEANPMVGLEGRASLLLKLGAALKSHPEFFGADARPGNIIDFLQRESRTEGDRTVVPLAALWHALIYGLASIWPSSRTTLGGAHLGDVWPCAVLVTQSADGDLDVERGEHLVPFHKLTQWLAYSLVEPLQQVMRWRVEGLEELTGLPEYRNGGLLMDLGVLNLRSGKVVANPETGIPHLPPSHPAIIEWRAMTVIELDRIASQIRTALQLTPAQLTLAQVLESATWKGGRELARTRRPETGGGPPVEVLSDGTVF